MYSVVAAIVVVVVSVKLRTKDQDASEINTLISRHGASARAPQV